MLFVSKLSYSIYGVRLISHITSGTAP